MDDVAPMLAKIRIHLEVTGRAADIQARRHVAVLAVALAAGVSAAVGAAAGQVPPWAAAAAGAAMAATVALQVRGLGELTRELQNAREAAVGEIDTLMLEEDP